MKSLRVILALGSLFCICGFLAPACTSTVTPARVEATQASFDGTEQNSGILGTQPGGFLVTAHFRDRFNALVADYGRAFAPALQRDEGLRPADGGCWFIDAGAMARFVRMNAWRKSGQPHAP
jgi:hypothetical protein